MAHFGLAHPELLQQGKRECQSHIWVLKALAWEMVSLLLMFCWPKERPQNKKQKTKQIKQKVTWYYGLDCCLPSPQKRCVQSPNHRYLWMWPYLEIESSADVIRLRWGHIGQSHDWCPYKMLESWACRYTQREVDQVKTLRHRGECSVKTEAEIEVIRL